MRILVRDTAAALLAAALLALPARAQQVEGRCFDVETGPWRPLPRTQAAAGLYAPPPDVSGDSVIYSAPPRVRLDATEAAAETEWRPVTVPDDALSTPHSFKGWRPMGDSLLLVLSTGYAGLEGRALPSGGGWAGTLRTFTDVGGTLLYERDVRLVPAGCDTPPPIPASADRRLPREVPLQDGPTLALARPLPAGVSMEPRRSGAWTILGASGGALPGADTIVVRLNRRGVLNHIELRFPPDYDVAGLARRLEAEHGPGVQSERSPGATWHNRTTTVYLFPAPAAGGRHRLLLLDPREGG
ncbi:MAG: hypothetical protein AMXMBFR53_25450 [Gemmatimonadota bacterium]